MVSVELLQEIFISIAIGTLIGIQREHHFRGKKEFAGLRTFALVSLFGTICAMLADIYGLWVVIVGFAAVSIFSAMGYMSTFEIRKAVGLTTEVVFIMAFALGIMIHTVDSSIPIALSVITTLILTMKGYTKELIKGVKDIEIMDTLKFAIIAFIILPILPDAYVDPFNIINPYHLWLLVIFIAGISFFGYFLMKIFGAGRGIVLTSTLGGLASSTAVTVAMSNEVRKNEVIVDPATVGVIIASTFMFFRILVEIIVVNIDLLPLLLPPFLAMGVVGLVASWFMLRGVSGFKHEIELSTPFSIGPAIKFTVFFTLILFATYFGNTYFGDTGLYITSLIAGLADVDAITLSVASLAKTEIAPKVASLAILIAALTNTFVKAGIAFIFGSKKFGMNVLKVFVLVAITGIGVALLI
jgi:uncharacterized membrane protein (DUF4010 family)